MVGYDELSALLGTYPDLIILRRFKPLAAQVLLHLQAELLELDDDLTVLKEAELKDPGQQAHARSWTKANESIAQGRRSLRKELVEDAEKKLLRYCKSKRQNPSSPPGLLEPMYLLLIPQMDSSRIPPAS